MLCECYELLISVNQSSHMFYCYYYYCYYYYCYYCYYYYYYYCDYNSSQNGNLVLTSFNFLSPFSDRQHLSYGDCLEVRGEIIRTVLCCIVY